MKIGIVPSVKEPYPNQFELSLDLNLVNFFYHYFKSSNVEILKNDNNKKNYNLIILSGGNDVYQVKKSKKNLLRKKIDTYFLKIALKKNIPILGICYGAQFLASKYGNKLKKIKGHNNRINKIKFVKNNLINMKFIKTKCYHNYGIQKKNKNLQEIGMSSKDSVECFKIINKKIYGIMWHPERDKIFKKYNYELIKNICN